MSDADLKHWADTWQRAGRELEQLRQHELAGMSDEMAKTAARNVLDTPVPADLAPRISSGLVEQQRLFLKLRGR